MWCAQEIGPNGIKYCYYRSDYEKAKQMPVDELIASLVSKTEKLNKHADYMLKVNVSPALLNTPTVATIIFLQS